ncbi:amino acid transporter [Helicobacter aurati]|uniref:Amino acid transporter n=1 Tax=Helicobacter aurati TaxID=137778 RepID=A0A3D8J8E5_9HELI|nr:LysE family transporter [Helicobacter aurati]RDU73698.1 amino acid transporter [Helicobacter aurati]
MVEYGIKGFLLSLSLIAAIGAQNLFILKQGILNNHVFWVCFVCFMCDVILINLGIFGVANFLANNKLITILLGICGTCFVTWYAINALQSLYKWRSIAITDNAIAVTSLRKTLLYTLIITLLNPHVYLDAIVIIGTLALSLNVFEKIAFACGSIFASGVWFFSLGFLANKASKYFRNPKTWVVINIMVALIMFAIAYNLLLFSINEICNL